MHINNAVEWTIYTFKDQFIAGLYTTDPDLTMQNWDYLIEQAEITLNLIRHSRLNSRLSAYSHLNIEFYLNCTPVYPLGILTLVNENPQNRGTWDPHRHEGK